MGPTIDKMATAMQNAQDSQERMQDSQERIASAMAKLIEKPNDQPAERSGDQRGVDKVNALAGLEFKQTLPT